MYGADDGAGVVDLPESNKAAMQNGPSRLQCRGETDPQPHEVMALCVCRTHEDVSWTRVTQRTQLTSLLPGALPGGRL